MKYKELVKLPDDKMFDVIMNLPIIEVRDIYYEALEAEDSYKREFILTTTEYFLERRLDTRQF
nr:MAG TPA: hypothetical protein [Caudoviricetes sp.]